MFETTSELLAPIAICELCRPPGASISNLCGIELDTCIVDETAPTGVMTTVTEVVLGVEI